MAMNKQEAITFIHQMLEQDHAHEEIVYQLVDQLKAPQAMVDKFVSQTEAEYRQSKARPPQANEIPDWLKTVQSNGSAVTAPDVALPSKAASPEIGSSELLPPWLQNFQAGSDSSDQTLPAIQPDQAGPSWQVEAEPFVVAQVQAGRINHEIASELADRIGIPIQDAENYVVVKAAKIRAKPLPKIANTKEAAEFVIAEYERRRPKLAIVNELAQRTGEPPNLVEKFVNMTITKHEKTKATQEPASRTPSLELLSALDKPEMVEYVIKQLSKHRKRNDIVTTLCERTGQEWSQVQTFVAQVEVDQRRNINARKNRLLIPMSIVIIIFGFILAITNGNYVLRLLTGYNALIIAISAREIFLSVVAFGFGLVLIAGGIIGIYFGVKSQVE
jgi:KaiC/GvpD/RAD55 family RecA-like ATPase